MKSLIRWVRLGMSLRRLAEAEKEERKMANGDYSFFLTVLKGLRVLGLGLGSAALGAVALYLSDPATVRQALDAGGLSPAVASAVTAVLTSVAVMLRDYAKHK